MKPKVFKMRSGYLDKPLNGKYLAKIVEDTECQLRKFKLVTKFDSLVFSGLSGSLVAPPVAMKLRKDLVCWRKTRETHSRYNRLEGKLSRRYAILDDFIESGDTIKDIRYNIDSFSNGEARLNLIILYNHDYDDGGLEYAARYHKCKVLSVAENKLYA
jgi:hypothetical protein